MPRSVSDNVRKKFVSMLHKKLWMDFPKIFRERRLDFGPT